MVETDGEDVMEVEVYKERGEHWKRGDRKKEKRNRRKNIEGKSEQNYFLYKLGLLGSTCVELDTHLLLKKNLILPCSCPRAEPIVVVLSLLLQILFIWARFERHNPLL